MFLSKLKLFFFVFISSFYFLPKKLSYNFIKNSPKWAYPKILKKIFKEKCGYNLNLIFPRTFNEKIQYLKLYDTNSLKTILTDKIQVMEFVKNSIDSKHIKKIYGIYNSFDDIDIDVLPDSFYLKTNHGCKMQKLIESKEFFIKNKESLKIQFEKWLNINFAYVSGFELQYKDIEPKIFAEEVIIHPQFMFPIDVEIYCFNGNPKLTSVRSILNEFSHGISLYSTEEGLLPYSFSYGNEFRNIRHVQLPRFYEDMLKAAKVLSKNLKFVRVDFLYTFDNFYFGEMTFTPFSGFFPMPNKELDKKMSKWLKL